MSRSPGDSGTVSTHVELEIFEGPLDLLLHLIKKNEVSITDIPIATITEQYLATLEFMQTLSLDVAGEFLVMASTLIHIKSRMLLPAGDDGGDEEEKGSTRAMSWCAGCSNISATRKRRRISTSARC